MLGDVAVAQSVEVHKSAAGARGMIAYLRSPAYRDCVGKRMTEHMR